MPRTTWQDLAREDPAAAAQADAARRAAGSPGNAADLPQAPPELQSLLAERARLQQALDRLTGHDGPDAGNARDARRFPLFGNADRDAARARDGERRSARESAEARAMDVERPGTPDGRGEGGARPRSADERAERAREAGAARVREAAAAWESHRERLLAARDLARQLAAGGRGLGLPGMDAPDRALSRRAESLAGSIERVERDIDSVGSALRSLEAGTRALSSADLRRDGPQALRALTRALRRAAGDELRDTAAGRRLAAMQDELAPPAMRELPGEGLRGGDELFDERRLRALDALRTRRDADAAPPGDVPRERPRAAPGDDGR